MDSYPFLVFSDLIYYLKIQVFPGYTVSPSSIGDHTWKWQKTDFPISSKRYWGSAKARLHIKVSPNKYFCWCIISKGPFVSFAIEYEFSAKDTKRACPSYNFFSPSPPFFTLWNYHNIHRLVNLETNNICLWCKHFTDVVFVLILLAVNLSINQIVMVSLLNVRRIGITHLTLAGSLWKTVTTLDFGRIILLLWMACGFWWRGCILYVNLPWKLW